MTAIEQKDESTTDNNKRSTTSDTSEAPQPEEEPITKSPVLPERTKSSFNESPSRASTATKKTSPVHSGKGVSVATGDFVAADPTLQSGRPDVTDKVDKQGKERNAEAANSGEQAEAKAKVRPKTAADIAMESLPSRVDKFGKGVKAAEFPSKPYSGSDGTAVQLQTNHFEIELPTPGTIYQYCFTISPFPTSPRMRRRILYLLLSNSNGFSKAATDYRSLIVSNAKLAGEDCSADFEVDYYGEGETGPRTGVDRTIYTVFVDAVRDGSHELSLLDLDRYI